MDAAVSLSPRVPLHLHEFTTAWLTAALQNTRTIDDATRVATCEPQSIVGLTFSGEAREDGGGISGPQIVRLQLTYTGGSGPASVVLKRGNWSDRQQMPAWPWKTRLVQVLGHMRLEDQFRSEIQFFHNIEPHVRGLQTPVVYYAALADAPNAYGWSYALFDRRAPLAFCTLMEDLSTQHFAPVRQGEGLSFERARRAFLNIAQLHASGWEQSQLWAQLQLRPTPWFSFLRADEGRQRRYRDQCLHTNLVPAYLKLWGHESDPMLQDPEMIAMFTALNASFPTWAEEAAKTARQAPQTWVHGDFHGWNHLFNPQDDCRIIDFQFFGKGRVADELAYFFMMSFDAEPEAEAELLRLYHHALVEAGVADYAWEQLLYEYRVSTLTLLLGGLVRAVKFVTPKAHERMLQDPKQGDLMRLGDIARERTAARALHWYRTPQLRQQFFSIPGR